MLLGGGGATFFYLEFAGAFSKNLYKWKFVRKIWVRSRGRMAALISYEPWRPPLQILGMVSRDMSRCQLCIRLGETLTYVDTVAETREKQVQGIHQAPGWEVL
jgi:hypothetical protein